MTRFLIKTAGYSSQGDEGLPLYEAALRLAVAYEMGSTVEALAVTPAGTIRNLTQKEAEALATAAALEITNPKEGE